MKMSNKAINKMQNRPDTTSVKPMGQTIKKTDVKAAQPPKATKPTSKEINGLTNKKSTWKAQSY